MRRKVFGIAVGLLLASWTAGDDRRPEGADETLDFASSALDGRH